MSATLSFRVGADGHLQAVPSRAHPPLTTLTFLVDGLAVSAPGVAPVLLSWGGGGHEAPVPTEHGSWSIVPWSVGRNGERGVAVRVTGWFDTAAAPIHAATMSPVRRLSAAFASEHGGRTLPVLLDGPMFDTAVRELSLISALCAVLHDTPGLRPRLEVPHRVRHLARDLERDRLTRGPTPLTLSGEAVDIEVAMRQLGYVHRYTRPLTSVGLPATREVVERVEATLNDNPYRQGRPVDRAQLERVVRRRFTEVAPWPFAGLVDD